MVFPLSPSIIGASGDVDDRCGVSKVILSTATLPNEPVEVDEPLIF